MKKTVKNLMCAFWGVVSVTLFFVLGFEADVLSTGALADYKNAEFVLLSLMELLTVVCIPVALRLFKIRRVAAELSADAPKAMLGWGLLRMMMLGIPMFVNTLLYYMFWQTTFGYMAIILLISMVFVYPSMGRCLYETQQNNDKQ